MPRYTGFFHDEGADLAGGAAGVTRSMIRHYYSNTISGFQQASDQSILGALLRASAFPVEQTQRDAWLAEMQILRRALAGIGGSIYFEYAIPRMGKRIDVVVVAGPAVFVLEFKVGATEFTAGAIDQVWDYALDLKNFHETSHDVVVAPVLIATDAGEPDSVIKAPQGDRLLEPVLANGAQLRARIAEILGFCEGSPIDSSLWAQGRYQPTPTIIEAAKALYSGHSVGDISRSDASAINLSATSEAISRIIEKSRSDSAKSICFVTGVPGAGKTLVGLNIATKYGDRLSQLHSVYLSGNGPLVAILREALARDQVRHEKEMGRRVRKGEAMSKVRAFIQNVHNFRDECLLDDSRPPIEHVALFDEAQRAWNLEQTAKFMRQKKAKPGFNQSEPEFLISCMDRHTDWAVVVCLVGGGQEINTGEAGIGEWFEALRRSFPGWRAYVSSRLVDSEYGAGLGLEKLLMRPNVAVTDELHLAVSMRSFRAENVSLLVKQVLDRDIDAAKRTLRQVEGKYPIVLTRDLSRAKNWLRMQARGSERYGVVVSSQAERLKPHAIDVKSPMDPVHWFLDDKEDVRSSYYLEDVATEFDIQGLELDWACVAWDGDFRHGADGWQHWSFVGRKWNRIRKADRQSYQKNAYRVLLTRARQGMVIVIPEGDAEDPTRRSEYYDPTFDYLQQIGFRII